MAAQPASINPAIAKAREALEEHVHSCYWCKFHPFARCGTGQELLRAIPLTLPHRKAANVS